MKISSVCLKKRSEYEGKVYATHKYGALVVTKYINKDNVYVKFLETGYTTCSTMRSIKKGNVKDRLSPILHGVGVLGECQSRIEGKPLKEYLVWKGILRRCYDTNYILRYPTYEGCEVSENFKHFSFFKAWCNDQIGFGCLDDKGKVFQLDKDILVKGSKVYSEDICVFVPSEINNALIKSNKVRGELPIGVTFNTKVSKYMAYCSVGVGQKTIGYYTTPEQAFYAYKQTKESYIKEVANKWKDQIDPRVYNALMNYEVEITD